MHIVEPMFRWWINIEATSSRVCHIKTHISAIESTLLQLRSFTHTCTRLISANSLISCCWEHLSQTTLKRNTCEIFRWLLFSFWCQSALNRCECEMILPFSFSFKRFICLLSISFRLVLFAHTFPNENNVAKGHNVVDGLLNPFICMSNVVISCAPTIESNK